MLNLPNKIARDERITTYLMPMKIIKIYGKTENSERLLKEPKFLQINIPEPDTFFLDNRESSENAAVLIDFGRELQGGIRLLISRAESDVGYPELLIRFGESCAEALSPLRIQNTTNDHSIRDFKVPATAMSDQTFGQTGFRYVYIELATPNALVSFKNILASFTYRDIPYLGSFSCDDKELCDIFNTASYTCHLCMQNYLWDGIKRDRLVWIGDSHIESKTIRYIFGNDKIINESMDEAVETYPLPNWMQIQSYSFWWVLILSDWYRSTGDKYLINKHKDYIIGLAKQGFSLVGENGEFLQKFNFLDHIYKEENKENIEPARIGVSALVAMAYERLGGIIAEYGEEELSRKCYSVSKLLIENAPQKTGVKVADAMMRLASMIDDDSAIETLNDGTSKGFSCFLSYYVLKALSISGKAKEALKVLKEFFGGMLKMGATTFWEAFEIDWIENSCPIDRIPEKGEKKVHGDFGETCYEGFRNSLCHGWASGAVPFVVEEILGIDYDAVAKKITLKPDLCGLKWAKGTFPLENGEIFYIELENTPDGIKITHSEHKNVEIIEAK